MIRTLLHRGQWLLLVSFALICFLGITAVIPAQAQETTFKTLTVTGQGKQMIPTTLAEVRLGVEIRGETAQQVQQQVANQTDAVVKLLRSRNVEQLQTTGIRLNPQYDYKENERRLLGYIGTNTVSFRTANEQAGVIMDEAVKAGATRIDGISFTATDPAIAAAQKQALKKATSDAQQQADAVLESLNLSRKEVVSIQVNGAQTPPPRPVPEMAAARVASDASTPVVGGDQTVRAAVTLQISY